MSPIRNSANIDLYERERVGSENFESGARTKKAQQLYFRGLVWRKADAWTLVYMCTVPGSTGSPSGLLEKKLCFIMCCHFFGPHFWLEKNSFVQKVSKSFKKFRLFKFRRVPISVYTEIPLLLGSSLDVSEKVVTARHGLISFWQNEFSPHPNWAPRPFAMRNVTHCGSWLWHCGGGTSLFDIFCSVKASFVLWISPTSGVQIWRRIRIFNQKLDLGMICYPSFPLVHFTPSEPVSIR